MELLFVSSGVAYTYSIPARTYIIAHALLDLLLICFVPYCTSCVNIWKYICFTHLLSVERTSVFFYSTVFFCYITTLFSLSLFVHPFVGCLLLEKKNIFDVTRF